MWTDPIVEDLKQQSERYASQFNFELKALFQDLREQQKRSGRAAVSLPPKPYQEPIEGASSHTEEISLAHRSESNA